MADILKILVETGNSVRNVDKLTASVEEFEKAINKPTKGRGGVLDNETQAKFQSNLSNLKDTLKAIKNMAKDPALEMSGLEFVQKQATAFQDFFKDTVALVENLSAQQLQLLKDRGVKLGPLYDGYLKDLKGYHKREENEYQLHYNILKSQRAQFSAEDLRVLKEEGGVKLTRADRAKLLKAEEYPKAVGKANTDALKLAEAAKFKRDQSELRAVRESILKSEAEAFANSSFVKSAMSYYYTLEASMRDNLAAKARADAQAQFKANSAAIKEELRKDADAFATSAWKLADMSRYYTLEASMRDSIAAKARADAQAQFKANSAAIKQELAKEAEAFAKSPDTLANMRKFYEIQERIGVNTSATARKKAQEAFQLRSATFKAEQQKLKGDNSEAMMLLRSQYVADGDKGVQSFMETLRPQLSKTTSETQALAKANKSLSEAFRQAGLDGNDLHSVSRGLASSFGLLWLTWGNLAPLFAGAAISSTVKNVVVLGAEIQHTMETIRVLSNESQDAVNGLNAQLLELARTGPYGPKEIAEAMKSLSLAGLNASEVTYAIKDVLNFAVAGTTDLKTAQTTLTSVASAFGIASDGYNYVGDVITKAAAVSQTSVEGMAAAFRSAASVHVQYGASLEDLAVGFAALSSVGIDFSSAGTMLRNFYADLSGRSPKVSKALKELNIDMRQQRDEAGNLTGKFVDLVQMFEIYQKGVERLSGPGQTEAFKTIFGERGGKLSAAGQLMSQMAAKEKENVDSGISRLREIQKSIQEESAGFMIQAATQLALTPQSQLKSIGASLQATFVEAFKDLEPEIAVFSKTLKDMFKSEEFKGSVEWLAETAMSFAVALTKVTKTVVENIGVFGTLIGLYYTARVGLAAYSALVAFKTIRQNADTVATVANTGATIANTAAQSANNVTKLGGLAAIARIVPGVGGFVTLAAGAWALYEMWANRGALANANFADNAKAETVIESLRQEADRLDKVNKAREQGIALQEYELKLKMQQGKQEAASSLEVARKRVQDAEKAFKTTERYVPGARPGTTKIIQDTPADRKAKEAELKAARSAEYKAIQQAQDMDDAIADLIAKAGKDAAARRGLKPKTFGTGQFNADGTPKDGGGGYAGFGPARFSPLESIIKRERMRGSELQASMEGSNKATLESKKAFTELDETYEQAFNSTKNLSAAQLERLQTSQKLSAEELKSTGLSEAQIAIEVERTKNAKGLTSEEYKALGISEKLTAEKIKKLNLNRLEVRQLLEDNAAIQKNIELRDKQVQGMQAGYKSSLELAQARSKAAKEEADAAALKAEEIKYQDSIRSLPSTLLMPTRDIEIAKNKIRLDAEAAKKKAEADTYTTLGNLPENDPEFHVKMVQEFELLAAEKKRIDQAAARDTSTAISEIYKEKWKTASQSMADDFASSIMNKSFTLKDFLKNQFNNLILKPQLQLVAQGGFDAIGALLKGGLNILAGSAGSYAVGGTRGPDNIDVGGGWNPAAGSFEGGGYTGNGPRAGGLDGRGGFMAMVHPNETIIDHTRGQSGSGPVYVTINNTVGDVATKSMLDQANANTVKQIQAGIYRSSKYNGAMAR